MVKVYKYHFFDVTSDNLGISNLDVTDVKTSLQSVDTAVQMVTKIRSTYGSLQNRLEGTADYLSSRDTNIQTAQSRIGDADIAEEKGYSKKKSTTRQNRKKGEKQ